MFDSKNSLQNKHRKCDSSADAFLNLGLTLLRCLSEDHLQNESCRHNGLRIAALLVTRRNVPGASEYTFHCLVVSIQAKEY